VGAPWIDRFFETFLKKIIAIGKASVVPSDKITQEIPEGSGWATDFVGKDGSGGGVVDFARDFGGVWVGFGFQVGLPCRREFSEVVPETGEAAPLAGGFAVGPGGTWRRRTWRKGRRLC